MDFSNIPLHIPAETLAILGFFGIGLATIWSKVEEKDWKDVRTILVCTFGLAIIAFLISFVVSGGTSHGVAFLQGSAVGLAASGLVTFGIKTGSITVNQKTNPDVPAVG